MRAHDDERRAQAARRGTARPSPVALLPEVSAPRQALLLETQRPARLSERRSAPSGTRDAVRARTARAALGLLLGGVLASACAEFTEPPNHRRNEAAPAEAAPPSASAPPAPPTTLVVADQAPVAGDPAEQIEASHILVSYQGAPRAKPTVTRTRDEARELATQLAARAHEPGVDFAQLAKDSSDGPSGVEGGALPRFGRQQMVKPFSDAAFALRPGEVSGVVETNFGFHVIKRLR